MLGAKFMPPMQILTKMTGLNNFANYLWAVAVLVMPASLVASETSKFAYPSEVTRTFLRGCQINPSNSKEFCQCSLQGLQEKYSFADFTKLDATVRETRQVPPEVQAIFGKCRQTAPAPKSKYDQASFVAQNMDINQLLENYLQQYSQQYQEFNSNPQAWEAKFGSWVEFENREKAKLLQEIGQILQLLTKITNNEQKLDTLGDLEYYSTAIQYLSHLRQFLETRTTNL